MLNSNLNIRNFSKLYESDCLKKNEMDVNSIEFDELFFREENSEGKICCECRSSNKTLYETINDNGEPVWSCIDTILCLKVKEGYQC